VSKNPIINGLVANEYVFLVVLLMNFGSKKFDQANSLLAPVAVISLFTLSAAVMGYLFGYQPIMLYIEGKKTMAVKYFVRMMLTFGVVTMVIMAILIGGFYKNY
jgi:hypothetical protein